jgi:hypothetical protein
MGKSNRGAKAADEVARRTFDLAQRILPGFPLFFRWCAFLVVVLLAFLLLYLGCITTITLANKPIPSSLEMIPWVLVGLVALLIVAGLAGSAFGRPIQQSSSIDLAKVRTDLGNVALTVDSTEKIMALPRITHETKEDYRAKLAEARKTLVQCIAFLNDSQSKPDPGIQPGQDGP